MESGKSTPDTHAVGSGLNAARRGRSDESPAFTPRSRDPPTDRPTRPIEDESSNKDAKDDKDNNEAMPSNAERATSEAAPEADTRIIKALSEAQEIDEKSEFIERKTELTEELSKTIYDAKAEIAELEKAL